MNGLFALRNSFAHGRPLRLEEDEESIYGIDSSKFSLRETIKTMRRLNILNQDDDFFHQAGEFNDRVFSSLLIEFYWKRVGDLLRAYLPLCEKSIGLSKELVGAVEELEPLGFNPF